MNQSELNFKENNKKCVWCTWQGVEFYWEINSCRICISDDYEDLFVPENANSALVRREIVSWVKGAFNV